MKPRAHNSNAKEWTETRTSRQSSGRRRCRGRRSQGRRGQDEDGDAIEAVVEEEGRRRSRCSQAASEACTRFARPGNASGTKARTGVANPGHARESAQPDTPLSEGPAEKASTAVAGADRRGRRPTQPACRSRRSSRGRDGDAGDEVVLDEEEAVSGVQPSAGLKA